MDLTESLVVECDCLQLRGNFLALLYATLPQLYTIKYDKEKFKYNNYRLRHEAEVSEVLTTECRSNLIGLFKYNRQYKTYLSLVKIVNDVTVECFLPLCTGLTRVESFLLLHWLCPLQTQRNTLIKHPDKNSCGIIWNSPTVWPGAAVHAAVVWSQPLPSGHSVCVTLLDGRCTWEERMEEICMKYSKLRRVLLRLNAYVSYVWWCNLLT